MPRTVQHRDLLARINHARAEAKLVSPLTLAYVDLRRGEGATYYAIGDELGVTASFLRSLVHNHTPDDPKPQKVLPARHYKMMEPH